VCVLVQYVVVLLDYEGIETEVYFKEAHSRVRVHLRVVQYT
jgi:hypothetical protein